MGENNIIDLEDIWRDYSEYTDEDFMRRELFNEMKTDMISLLSEYVELFEETEYESILENLEYSANIKEWNSYWNDLYVWADYNNVTIKTGF